MLKRMRNILSLLLIILLPTALIAQTKSLVFARVTVIDMVDAKPRKDMTVIVEGNRITSIGSTKRIAAVVFNGRYLSKEAREKMLADVEAMTKKK